ncbi:MULTISPECIES: helix-turn-helix domain-containing protein [Pseudoalteromonas]|uniref:helix-turn-helix transcriptional regulator n=1 Tax=Pseudoalteromonas TaxID=53246 RepID=UPI00281692C9|nr:helix-turn-helix domain-containing protein [Pseudoalteromonas sp. HL-AS1]WMS90239.1 helix-turn-helix domain-containing protein [Pseudoalteromonas sp. HL-AS1]
MDKLFTAGELATFLRTSKAQVYNTINKGGDGVDIPQSIKIGRRRLWPKCAIDGWVEHKLSEMKDKTPKVIITAKKTINRI